MLASSTVMWSSGYKWKELSDLPEDIEPFRDRELESLAQAWMAERQRLDPNAVFEFNSRLAREWAIETGIIENVYTLDRGTTQTLIERGIDSAFIPHDASNLDSELVARMIRAHADVLEGLFAFVIGERRLSTSYIKQLHAELLRYQETVVVFDQFGKAFDTLLEKELYKKLPNSPSTPDGSVHEYCPPEHVSSEMDRLVELHRQHGVREIPAHVEAAWIHHAFTQVHPFQDGNGRVARAIATAVLIKDGYFPLIVDRDQREKYIIALRGADDGNLIGLSQFFALLQKRLLTKAISMVADVTPVSSVDEALNATTKMLRNLNRITPLEYIAAKEHARSLLPPTNQRLQEVIVRLDAEIARVNNDFQFRLGSFGGPPVNEIQTVARKLGYDPNTTDFHGSLLLELQFAQAKSRIVVSFHSVGPAFRGLLVGVAYFQAGDGPAIPVCDDAFRISYYEKRPGIEKRYSGWLDQCIIRGLAEWRRTLV